MKTLSLTFALSTILLLPALQAKDFFEGTYTLNFSADGESYSTDFWVKEGNMRMKVDHMGNAGEMIMRDGMQSMLIIMPAQKMYMEMPIELDNMPDVAVPDEEDLKSNPFKKTGETKKIHGYTAHQFIFEQGVDRMEVWASDELGSMPLARNPMLDSLNSVMREVTGLDAFFPLEMIGYERGRKSYSMKVEEIEKKELPDSLFTPPANFRKMTMPAGMGGFMQP